jgi:nucleotide-binding universal stress UspA family protein
LFKHILIPTDGSALAAKAIKAGVKLAQALGARVSGVYVVQPYLAPVYSEPALYMTGAVLADYEKAAKAQARKALAVLERAAAGARAGSGATPSRWPRTGAAASAGPFSAARRRACSPIPSCRCW